MTFYTYQQLKIGDMFKVIMFEDTLNFIVYDKTVFIIKDRKYYRYNCTYEDEKINIGVICEENGTSFAHTTFYDSMKAGHTSYINIDLVYIENVLLKILPIIPDLSNEIVSYL